MLFNSIEFIFIFLPVTFLTYFYLNKKNYFLAAKLFLITSSLFFYAWWNVVYLPLLLISVTVNYFIGVKLSGLLKKNRKKFFLIAGVIFNIFLLGYFKYFDFFIQNINFFTEDKIDLLNLTLPLAISFFTFQQIAFIVDSYKGKVKEHNFLNYTLFVSFFPQLIAGPIVHHHKMMPQFNNQQSHFINYNNIAMGLFIFSMGLFKKVVLADTFAAWAAINSQSAVLSFAEAWVTSLSFTFQLYFDFSGYTDMAIGLALLFNIKLPVNFNSPYQATSLIKLWSSWHMTLSQFVNSYVFNPIVKSFKSYTFTKGMLALFLSMFIIGMWHGASWLFVAFSLMHGVGIVGNHIWKRKVKINIPEPVGWFLTFNHLNISIIFFSVKEWSEAINILKGMFDFSAAFTAFVSLPALLSAFYHFITLELSGFMRAIPDFITTIILREAGAAPFPAEPHIWLLLGFVIIFNRHNSQSRTAALIKDDAIPYRAALMVMLMLSMSLNYILVANGQEFLYFNF